MKNSTHPVTYDWRAILTLYWTRAKKQFTSPWTKLIFLVSLAILLTQQELAFGLSLHTGQLFGGEAIAAVAAAGPTVSGQNVSMLTANRSRTAAGHNHETLANDPVRRRRLAYVETYRAVAEAEMREHGIPASITLAQGLLESGAGESSLAKNANNHFGIKCFSRSCSRGHCTNFDDDTHKDFFIVYESPEASYASHSRVLLHRRYRDLFALALTDYRGWARGLSEAGYATDPEYANKLIRLVEEYDLDQYDLAR